MAEVSAETIDILQDVHSSACDIKESMHATTGMITVMYERLTAEIIKRDERIKELENEIEEQINVIIQQRNKIKQRS